MAKRNEKWRERKNGRGRMEIKKAVKKMEKVRDRSGILSSRSRTPLPKLMQSCQSFYAICNRISLRRRGATLPSPPPFDNWLADRFDVASIKDFPFSVSLSLPLVDSRLALSPTFLRFGRKKSVLRFFSTFPPSFQPPVDGFSSDIRRRWSQYSPDTTAFSHSAW